MSDLEKIVQKISLFLTFSVPIIIVLLIPIILANGCCRSANEEDQFLNAFDAKVIDKYVCYSTRYTELQQNDAPIRVYVVEDSDCSGGCAETYANMIRGCCYKFTTQGKRNPHRNTFPNILCADEVENEHCSQ